MSDILIDHAIRNVWAESIQDRQHHIKPSRISPKLGFRKEATVMWERIPLPNYNTLDTTAYHVYSLGQIPTAIVALNNMAAQTWIRCSDLCVANDMVIDIYADNGCIIPPSVYWLYLNYDGNLIVAIERNTFYIGTETRLTPYNETLVVDYSLDYHDITVRFYSNAIIQSNNWVNAAVRPNQPISIVSKKINSAADLATFLRSVDAVIASYNNTGGRAIVTGKQIGRAHV